MRDALKRVEAAMLENLKAALDHPVGDRRTSNRKAASEWAAIVLALRAKAEWDRGL